jgi:peptidylprolyl isomerase
MYMIRADKGDIVKVHYTGRLADGTVFDASPADRPLHFITGKEEVIPGFEAAVTGMYLGEKKSVTIPAEQAYGPHHERYVDTVERSRLPAGLELKVGRQIEVTCEDDERLLLLVTALTETTVTLDGNHPLAGKDLHFDIELLAVDKKPPV